jgi:hypothetical protein
VPGVCAVWLLDQAEGVSLARTLFAPVGAVGGPVVGAVILAWARLFNGSRLRPLRAAERVEVAGALSPEALDGVRVAEGCTLPLMPGFVGITLGSEIYLRGRCADQPGLLGHELVHVGQFRRLGWLGMTAAYGRQWVQHGYGRHPMELEARRHG